MLTEEYLVRKATLNDLSFLADVVIGAEKSNSDKLSYSTLFNLPEDKVKERIILMFEEGNDEPCEFSANSYLIAEHKGVPVASFGAWMEGGDENISSQSLKSNLIIFAFGKASIQHIESTAHVLNDVFIEREKGILQFEYLFITEGHRGRGLGDRIIQEHILNATRSHPSLEKAQVQVFANNVNAIKLYERNGFQIKKVFKSNNKSILDYLPYNEKILMERKLNQR